MKKYYQECEFCGSNLDPGERCDCMKEEAEKDKRYKSLFVTNKEGQLKFKFEVG